MQRLLLDSLGDCEMTIFRKLLCLSIASLHSNGTAVSAVNAAFLEGNMMQANLLHKTTQQSELAGVTSEPFVVGPGVELMGFGERQANPPLPPLVDIDVSDNQILVTLVMDQPFAFQEELNILDFAGTIRRITNVTLNPASDWAGFNGFPRLGFGPNSVNLNVAQLAGLAGQKSLLDVVPEPAAAALLATALAAVVAIRRPRCR